MRLSALRSSCLAALAVLALTATACGSSDAARRSPSPSSSLAPARKGTVDRRLGAATTFATLGAAPKDTAPGATTDPRHVRRRPGHGRLHGWTPDPSVFGHAVSNGCIRVPAAALTRLRQVPLGSLVLIR